MTDHNDDLVEIKVELAVALEQIKGLREEVHSISIKLDKIADLEVSNRIKITALVVLAAVSGGASGFLMKMVG